MISEQTLEQLWKEHLKKSNKEKWGIYDFFRDKFHKWRAPERLFKLFKSHLRTCKPDGSTVVVAERFSPDSLRGLFEANDVCAIHIPKFCPPDMADSLSNRALEEYTHWKLGGVISTDMFYAGGSIPKEVADHSWPDFHRYFSEREDFLQKQRTMSGGNWPVDHFRLALDEAWPFGVCLGNYLGYKLRPAIMRIMQAENKFDFSIPKHGIIHTDDSPKLKPLHGIFSTNIYLRIPEEGGELYVWGINLNRTSGIANYLSAQLLIMIMSQNYVFNEDWQHEIYSLLLAPHVIKPKAGDLVMFHSGRPHSVAPVTKGTRVTNQLFIRAEGSAPLNIYS